MTVQQSFFIDVLSLMPVGAKIFIQAPSMDNESFLRIMKDSEYEYFKYLDLSSENKKILINEISSSETQKDIQRIEIKFNNHLLFEGFDGVEFGTISKVLDLPDNFILKYFEGYICVVAKDW